MPIRIETEYGIISFNKLIFDDLVSMAARPFEGRLWLADYKGNDKEYADLFGNFEMYKKIDANYTDKGIFLKIYIITKVGESINEMAGNMLSFIESSIENDFQLPVDDIEIILTAVVSERIAKRNVKYSLRNKG